MESLVKMNNDCGCLVVIDWWKFSKSKNSINRVSSFKLVN
jgi:hypothetical protein